MGEGRVTIQAKNRAIHDDTHFGGKQTPLLGEIDPLSAPCGQSLIVRRRIKVIGRGSSRSVHAEIPDPASLAAWPDQSSTRLVCEITRVVP